MLNVFFGSFLLQNAAGDVVVPGINTPPRGSGDGISLTRLPINGGSSNKFCEDLDGRRHGPGVVIQNPRLHRRAVCQPGGNWKDFDTCDHDTGIPSSRLDNPRNCWYSCQKDYGSLCDEWCSCSPGAARLGASQLPVPAKPSFTGKHIGSTSPVKVTGSFPKPKGNGKGMSKQTLQSTARSNDCCFTFGYGAQMVPCCLKIVQCGGAEFQKASQPGMVGGGAGISTHCPSNAAEAEKMAKAVTGYCQDLEGNFYPTGSKIVDNTPPFTLHRLSICQESGEWFDYDTCPADMPTAAFRLYKPVQCWNNCYKVWGHNCNKWCTCEDGLIPSSKNTLGASSGVSPVVVTGVFPKPKGNGKGISKTTLLSTSGTTRGWCEDQDRKWYKAGEKILNDPPTAFGNIHRLSICQESGEWLDEDTCPMDMHSNAYRLDDPQQCWSYCYSDWNNDCARWCSCQRDYNNKKLGSSAVSPVRVQVTGVAVKPKGNGKGISKTTLLSTSGRTISYCPAQDGEWYKAGTVITNDPPVYSIHRRSVCQESGEWFDYDMCPQDFGSLAYRLEDPQQCWSYCYSDWNNDCDRWCSCEHVVKTKKLGSSALDQEDRLGVSGPLGWLFPGTEGARCIFGQWCYPGLECKPLLGNRFGEKICVQRLTPFEPVPAPVPVINWNNRDSPAPAPVPVPFGGRRLEGLERMQEQMN